MKKLLSTAMALVLIIGLLTGCSVESQGEKTESVSNQYYLYYLNKDETKVTKTRYYPEQESAEFMLQEEGAIVTKAWNGQEAVEIFEKSRPGEFDVILIDIMMPVMNGYEAAKRIRSLDREDAQVIPIIAMTANAFAEDRLKAKEAGMNEHIAKPVDGKLLVKVIQELVE